MQERSATPSAGNILGFVVTLALTFAVYTWVTKTFFPPPPQAARAPADDKQQKNDKTAPQNKPDAGKKADGKKPLATVEPKPSDEPIDQTVKNVKPAVAKPAAPPDNDERRWVTLGSVDPDLNENPYRMLITLSREGGALARLELSSVRYRDLDDRSGYLGHLVMDRSDRGPGCLVQVAGPGTPAAKAGIKPGDRITEAVYRGKSHTINDFDSLEAVLRSTEPSTKIDLTVHRAGEKEKKDERLTVALIRRPLEVIRPERRMPNINWIRNGPTDAVNPSANCPAPFLTTLQQVDEEKLRADEDPDAKFEEELARELPGVTLRNALWTIEGPKPGEVPGSATKVVFSCEVPKFHLKVTKTYALEQTDPTAAADANARAYHLMLTVAITNNDRKKHDVAYRQDGPNGLPAEGSWYVSAKVGRTWSTEGLRDVVYQLAGNEVGVATCSQLAEKVEKVEKFRRDIGESSQFAEHRPLFFGVDAQYFSVAMFPDAETTAPNIERAVALRVGDIEDLRKTLTNTSLRLISKPMTLEPGATSVLQRYEVFAGPKRPQLLATYQLSGLINYGWPIFRMVAVPMTYVLEFFYMLVHNYGLAIIMLTIVVRLGMHPMSRKQAQNALMMQKLQPELKEIQKKMKKDPEAGRKAQQELFAKHNYNPLGGCLLLLIQMPIFLGLYRALQVDVELRDAPLISHAVRWCSNLAAPDMLFDWSGIMPHAVNNGTGFLWLPLIGPMLGLGPYLNLFPIITLVLFILQQKVMMPPAADEQAEMQQKMMKYMMVLMGLMFFKVAAGLCIYFIASTLWGLAEKRFLPKATPADGDSSTAAYSKPLPSKPRLSESEREIIRRQKRKR
jgi:YidC/Oxa1 family membrane protein insertase